jgi:hypothetical protein
MPTDDSELPPDLPDEDEPPPLPEEISSINGQGLPVAELIIESGGLEVAEDVAVDASEEPPDLPPIPEPYRGAEWGADPAPVAAEPIAFTVRACDWLENIFGFASIVVTLAVLSAIPILNFLSLGYLLQVSGNVAKSGRFRSGFIGIKKAAKAGSLIIGTWLVLWPVRVVAGFWQDAELIAPGGPASTSWGTGTVVLTVITILHIGWAWIRGGKLRHFFWPAPIVFFKWLRQPKDFDGMGQKVLTYAEGLRLKHYFWLGARGFAGGLCWLIVPVSILIGASFLPPGGGGFLSLIGSAGLFLVVLYLPFLQAHFALQNRLSAMFEVGTIRQLFRRAPIAFWTALFITLLFALPLYFLKVEMTPKEVAWLPGLLFVMFIFPARILTGWAVSRAIRHETPRLGLFRWAMRLAAIPVVGFYVVFVYLSQFYSWDGVYSLLEQHAFMVPAPLMGM